MSLSYIAFDFGSWETPAGLDCPRHGPQDGGLAISVQPQRDAKRFIRKYCGLCALDALDLALGHDRGRP